MKYEYKIVTPKMTGMIKKQVDPKFVDELNQLGQDGWELVAVTSVTSNMGISYGGTTALFVYHLKRLCQ